MVRIAILKEEGGWGKRYEIEIFETDISDIMLLDWPRSKYEDFAKVSEAPPIISKRFTVGDVNHWDVVLNQLKHHKVDLYFVYDNLGFAKESWRTPKRVKEPTVEMRRVLLITRVQGGWGKVQGILSISVEQLKSHLSSDFPPSWLYEKSAFEGTMIPDSVDLSHSNFIDLIKRTSFKRDKDGILVLDTVNHKGKHTYIPSKPSGKIAFDSYGKAYGGYSTHSLPTRNAERLGESAPKKRKENPKSIERYVKEYAEQRGYADAESIPKNEKGKAFAIAWSRYCSKRPNSPRCKKDKGSYFPGRPEIARGIEKSMADKREKRKKKP